MGGHELRKQKQAARKQAKRAKRQAERNTPGPTEGRRTVLLREAQRAASCPIHECLINSSMPELGIGNVFVARRFPESTIALAIFLVDRYCLGVKDAMFATMSLDAYVARIDAMHRKDNFVELDPCCARKLVDGSIAYARGLGFSPHADYALAKALLADVDTEACEAEFEFGYQGKPLYVPGPDDSPAKVRRIMNTLSRRVGRDGFDFVVPGENEAAFGARSS